MNRTLTWMGLVAAAALLIANGVGSAQAQQTPLKAAGQDVPPWVQHDKSSGGFQESLSN